MHQRVTAIVVARSGGAYLERTLDAIDGQERGLDAVVGVDIASSDSSRAVLEARPLARLLSADSRASFGTAVSMAVRHLPAAEGDEWLWLLRHDDAPEPGALAALLAAADASPRLAVAGPKLIRWGSPDVMAGFGESMTRLGATVHLVEGELDQGQHDDDSDVMAVATSGMLVRRSVFEALGGLDPALPTTDAGLDFCVRARLAGHHVEVVPAARVASAGGPELFGRRATGQARRARSYRSALLHRRLVYAHPLALPLVWLSLVPLAAGRSVLQLLAKRPDLVPGEFLSAFAAAFRLRRVARARRSLARTRTVGWATIRGLRLTAQRAREYRARHTRMGVDDDSPALYDQERVGVVAGGALWIALAAAVVGVVVFGRLLVTGSLAGGALLPLAADPGTLWSHVGWGTRPIDVGLVGAADPFAYVLALLGSITFWQPSLSLVILWLVALPLASLGAWFCVRARSSRAWLPAVASVAWAVAPPFLAALQGGQAGAVITHVALPWLVLALSRATRSWPGAASAGILAALVTASSPSLAPALLLLWLVTGALRPRALPRLVLVALPSAVLFAPLVVDQVRRGTPWGLLADPGLPVPGAAPSALQLALASVGDASAWGTFLDGGMPGLTDPGATAQALVAVLLLPLLVTVLFAFFVHDARRAAPALLVAVLGFVTAVLAARSDVSVSDAVPVPVWAGAGLSLYLLGLLGAAAVALDRPGRRTPAAGALLVAASVVLAVPLLAASLLGVAQVGPGTGRILPAFVDAETRARPGLGSVVLTPLPEGAFAATLERGRGATLDAQSTLYSTAQEATADRRVLASLAGNLVSRSGTDVAGTLDDLAVGFVVLTDTAEDEAFLRAQEALDANPALVAVGETPTGLLWRYDGLGEDAVRARDQGLSNTGTTYGVILLVVQGLVFGVALLLAVPIRRRHAPGSRAHGSHLLDDDAAPFDEDLDD
jgi:GT2 family glycosyltransferase